MKKRIIRACVACAAVFALLFVMAGTAIADPVVTQTDDSMNVVDDDAGYGLSGVERLQVGSNRAIDGTYYGYVYATGNTASAANNLIVLALKGRTLVYIPTSAASKAGVDVSNTTTQNTILSMLCSADDELANGGNKLSSLSANPVIYLTTDTYEADGLTVRFNQEISENHFYTTVNAATADDARAACVFCEYGQLLPASEVTHAGAGSFLDNVAAFFAKLDPRPLWVSLKTAGVAMIFIFILGLLAAWRSMHVKSRWKSILDSIFTIPMVLPPTVCGFILLLIFGKSTGLGQFLIDHGIDLVFTWEAAVISAVVVSFPLMYRTALGAFEALDTNMLDAARTLGWSEVHIFRKLMLPLAWPSIAAGTVLAFARAMGEFGATLFFAGNYAGITQTIPIAIYFNWMSGSTDVALFWVIVVIIFSFIVILFINMWSKRTTKYRRKEVIEDGPKR